MWHLCFSNNTLSDGHNQPRFTLRNVFTFKLIQSVLLWKSFFGDYSREFKATFPNQCFAWPNPFRTLSTETRSLPWWWSSFLRPCRPATTSPTTWPAPWSSPRTSPSPPQPSGPGSVSFPLQILYLHKQANLAFRDFLANLTFREFACLVFCIAKWILSSIESLRHISKKNWRSFSFKYCTLLKCCLITLWHTFTS